MSPVERRLHPRFSVRLPLTLHFQERRVQTHIEDLSRSGMRLRTPSALPLMSRVQIALELPGGPTVASSPLAITGVVVRCDASGAEAAAPYETAIYFEDLSETARSSLARFLDSRRA